MPKVKSPTKKNRSMVKKSPSFDAIIEKYNLLGRQMTVVQFFNDYVKQLDPNISYDMWYRYHAYLRQRIEIRSEELTQKVTDNLATENAMENSSMRKILAISDLTLDKVIEKPDLLESVPLEQRIQWLFSAMKARDSRMVAVAKLQQEKRKTSMYEDMLQGAQYGAIDAEDVSDSRNVKREVIASPAKPEAVKTGPKKADVEFSPAEFEQKQYAD
jgi:hypothetical protein